MFLTNLLHFHIVFELFSRSPQKSRQIYSTVLQRRHFECFSVPDFVNLARKLFQEDLPMNSIL